MPRIVSSSCQRDSFAPSNMVVLFHLDHQVNLNLIADSLPILLVSPDQMTRSTQKQRVGFYGQNNVAVGVRYGSLIRGIREKGGMDSVVEIDLQLQNRNVHLKLSSSKVNVMGVKCEEAAIAALNLLSELIIMAQQHIDYIHQSSLELLHAHLIVLSEHLALTDYLRDDKLHLYMSYSKLLELVNSHQLDLSLMQSLYVRALEFNDFNDFVQHVMKLRSYTEPLTHNAFGASYGLSSSKYEIVNSSYSFRLLQEDCSCLNGIFVLTNLAEGLARLQDTSISPQFNNWASKNVFVLVTFVCYNAEGQPEEVKHRFNISQDGNVRQWSPEIPANAFVVSSYLVDRINEVIQNTPQVFISN